MLKRALAGLALLAVSGSVAATILYQEDFETGVARGFTYSDLGNTWHVTGNFPATGLYALGYVVDETPGSIPNGRYPFGTGAAISPRIALAPAARNVLTLDLWGWVEPWWDFFDVLVYESGPQFRTVASTEAVQTMPGGLWIRAGEQYQRAIFDLTALGFRQEIWLRFGFWVSDGDQNDFPGARVDNIRVEAFPLSEPGGAALLIVALFAAARAAFTRASPPPLDRA